MRVAVLAAMFAATAAAQEPAISFFTDVRPILQASCFGCHQPAKAKGDLVLTTCAQLLAGDADRAPLVVPGEPDASPLIEVVTSQGGEPPAMPEKGAPLSSKEVDLLRRWIAAGAIDDTPASTAPRVTADSPPTYTQPPVVTSLAFSPDGALLAVPGRNEVLLLRADGSGPIARLIGLAERIEAVAFSADGARLAVVGGAPGRFGELQIWNVAERSLHLSKLLTTDCLFGVSWSPDGKLVAFGCTDSTLRAIDATSGEQVLYQGAHNDWVLDTVFSTDGSHLVTVGRDRSMKLILVKEQQFIDNITSITPGALRGGLMAVDRHPTADQLLVGGADGEPKLFKMYREEKRVIGDDHNRIRSFERLPGRVYAVEFRRDGERLVVGSSHGDTGVVRVCVTGDGRSVWTTELPGGIYAAAFRPDGKVVAAAGFSGRVHLLDADTGEQQRAFVPVPIEPRRVLVMAPRPTPAEDAR